MSELNSEPPREEGGSVFHAGCGTIGIAAVIGVPLGMVVADELTGHPGFGGFFGFLVMLLVLGFIIRRAQILADRGIRLPGPFGSSKFWGSIGIGLFVAFFLLPSLITVLASAVIGYLLYRRDRNSAAGPPL